MGQRPLGNTDPVRSLLPPIAGPVSDHVLRSLYRPSPRRSVRAMMVSTVDGAATGSDGTSSSIKDTVDARAFAATRHHADVVLVGARDLDPFERALVEVAIAAARHDLDSAVYGWTFARYLAR